MRGGENFSSIEQLLYVPHQRDLVLSSRDAVQPGLLSYQAFTPDERTSYLGAQKSRLDGVPRGLDRAAWLYVTDVSPSVVQMLGHERQCCHLVGD